MGSCKRETVKIPEMITLVDARNSREVLEHNRSTISHRLGILAIRPSVIPPPLRPEVHQSFVDGQDARVLIPPALQSKVI